MSNIVRKISSRIERIVGKIVRRIGSKSSEERLKNVVK